MKKNVHITNTPDLLDIQRSSFCWFLSEGLAMELKKFSSIFDLGNKLELRIYGNEYKLKVPRLTTGEAKLKTLTYSLQLYVNIEIIKKNKPGHFLNFSTKNQLVEKKSLLIGEIPLM